MKPREYLALAVIMLAMPFVVLIWILGTVVAAPFALYSYYIAGPSSQARRMRDIVAAERDHRDAY